MTPQQLRNWRLAHRLSQRQAAYRLGVAVGTYCQWEQGRHAIPHPVVKLIAALQRLEDWGEFLSDDTL